MRPHPYLTLVGQPEPIQAQGPEDQAWTIHVSQPAMYFKILHILYARSNPDHAFEISRVWISADPSVEFIHLRIWWRDLLFINLFFPRRLPGMNFAA